MYRKATLNNLYDQPTHKTFKYNMTVFKANNLVIQNALDLSTCHVLLAFQYSLNEDGFEAVASVITSGNFHTFLILIVESAINTMLISLENIIYNDDAPNTPVDDILNYITNNTAAYKQLVKNFAYSILTDVISPLVTVLHQLKQDGITIDTVKIVPVRHDRTSVEVICYTEKIPGLPLLT